MEIPRIAESARCFAPAPAHPLGDKAGHYAFVKTCSMVVPWLIFDSNGNPSAFFC